MQKKSVFFPPALSGVVAVVMFCCITLSGCAGLFSTPEPKPKPGYFAVADLPTILNEAAKRVENNLDIHPLLSEVRLDNNVARVDFTPPSFPKGLSFVLEPLIDGQTSNTIAFKLVLPAGEPEPDGMLAVACAAIIIEVSQPGTLETTWAELEDIFAEGGEKTYNGWLYRCAMNDQSNTIVFSATAPAPPQQ